MSINLYQTGVSGLLSAQQQLATTGHNIANVNTEGYTRQRADQGTMLGNVNGGNYIGSGTYVQDITRIYDQFSYKEQLLNKSNLGNADSISLDLNQLNEIMSFSGEAISGSIDRFYQAVNGIADNPSDIGLRNIALSQASVLAQDFNSLNNNLDQLEKSTNGEIEQIASKISQISFELAKMNEQILQNKDLTTAGQPNDLLDKRDQLITELGEYTSVSTVQDSRGVMTVMIGSGTTLVAGTTPLIVSVESGDPDPMQTQLKLVGAHSSVSLDGAKLGGAISAKFEYRDEHISKARSELNLLAMGISETLNQAQAKGLDLNGKQGLDIFTDINTQTLQNARVLPSAKNSGNVQAGINITDVSLLPSNEFTVKYDGSDYVMTNELSGTKTTLAESSPGSGVYETDFGFEFTVNSGSPDLDDSFTLRPTENSAALMAVTLTDPKSIAASSAIEVSADDNNVSNGAVSIINVTDPEVARSFTEGTYAQLTVDVYQTPLPAPPASQTPVFEYRVYDAANPPPMPVIASGSFSDESTVIDMPPLPATPAFQIEISGSPVGQGALAREKFMIADAFGSGNASNAALMAASQEQQILGGGKQSFSQVLANATAEVGSNASSAELVADTAQTLFTQAFNRNQSKSGVNLDEEAANMLKYQQAYQAASQIISVANTIFDTLLAAAR